MPEATHGAPTAIGQRSAASAHGHILVEEVAECVVEAGLCGRQAALPRGPADRELAGSLAAVCVSWLEASVAPPCWSGAL